MIEDSRAIKQTIYTNNGTSQDDFIIAPKPDNLPRLLEIVQDKAIDLASKYTPVAGENGHVSRLDFPAYLRLVAILELPQNCLIKITYERGECEIFRLAKDTLRNFVRNRTGVMLPQNLIDRLCDALGVQKLRYGERVVQYYEFTIKELLKQDRISSKDLAKNKLANRVLNFMNKNTNADFLNEEQLILVNKLVLRYILHQLDILKHTTFLSQLIKALKAKDVSNMPDTLKRFISDKRILNSEDLIAELEIIQMGIRES